MKRFRELEAAYAEYDATQPDPSPCGSCLACCRADGRASHPVSELELRYLERHVGPQQAFRAFLARERRSDGSLRHEVCPHWEQGCRIYARRPLTCRTCGPWREMGTTLPAECAYLDSCQTVSRRDWERRVPGAATLKRLVLELRAEQPSGAAAVGDLRSLGDPLDVALRLARRGQAEEARAELERALQACARHPAVLANAGLIEATLGDHSRALELFSEACREEPGSADNHYYAATQALALQELALALAWAERAHELDPEHFRTLGLLGGLYCRLERWADAVRVLEPACQRPDLHGVNQAYLEQARQRLGASGA